MANIYDMTDIWNAGGTTFSAIKMNVTDTTSAAASLLLDLQVGGSTKFKVTKTGKGVFPSGSSSAVGISFSGVDQDAYGIFSPGGTQIAIQATNNNGINVFPGNVEVIGSSLGWGTAWGGTADVKLFREAAQTLAQRNGANAQTYRVYGTYTDASNYRRVAIAVTTAGVASLAPEGAGTGATGNVLHISGLPTANPGPGILWNNAGAVVVGT